MVSIVQSALFVAFFFVLATSVLFTSLLKFKTVIPYLLTIYLLTFGNITITGEIAGLANQLNNRIFFLILHLIILIISYIIWKIKGSPALCSPLLLLYKEIKTYKLIDQLKRHAIIVILGIGVATAYLIGIILILQVAPNNYDALTGHIVRIGYWFQHGNFKPWPTWFTVQTEYPINAQIQVLWSILFWRTDKFAGFTQWFAAIFSILSVYGLGRLLKRTRSQSLFACFIYALFPIIILESTTVQPHLCASTLVLISFFFLITGFRENKYGELILAGLAFGLALGVHLLVIFLLPGFILTVLYLGISNKKNKAKSISMALGSTFICFLFFSSMIYIQNSIQYKYPLGSYEKANPWSPQNSGSITQGESYWNPKNIAKYTFYNLSKYSFSLFDLTGIPKNAIEPLYNLRDAIYIPLFNITKNPLQLGEFDIKSRITFTSENSAWFGLIGYILLLPLVFLGTHKAIKKADPTHTVIIINSILYIFIWSGLIARESSWHMFSSRYFIPVGILLSPIIALIYSESLWKKVISSFLVIGSLIIAYNTINNNYAKPLYNNGAILNWSRLEQIYNVSWDQYPIIQAVEEIVPKNATLGLMLVQNTIEYPFFGEYFKRTLIPIFPYEKIYDIQWIEEENIGWILSCVDSYQNPLGFQLVKEINLSSPAISSTKCMIFKHE